VNTKRIADLIKLYAPPELTADTPPVAFSTDAQIAEVVGVYVEEMRARGFTIGPEHADVLAQAARIFDVWRVAFARVRS